MTYVRSDWDLYIVHLLVQVREYNGDSDDDKSLVETNHHLESILFQAESPEKSLEWAIDSMASRNKVDRGGKYDLRESECIGVYDLDNTQKSVSTIDNEIAGDIGFSVDCINIENIEIENFIGLPLKERLKLFQDE